MATVTISNVFGYSNCYIQVGSYAYTQDIIKVSTDTKVKINSISMPLGTGSGSFTTGTSLYGNGESISVYLTTSSGVSSKTVSVTNSVYPTSGYPDSSYKQVYTFTFTNLILDAGDSITIQFHPSGSGSVLTFWPNDTSNTASYSDPTYTIAYYLQGGSGSFPSQTKTAGVSIKLNSNSPKRSGYEFLGWAITGNTSEQVVKYHPGDTYTTDANLNLYAMWKEVVTYTVTYHSSTRIPSQTKQKGVDLTLSTIKPTKTGYTFKGWSTSSSSSTVSYLPGATYTKDADLDLYEVWQIITYTITYHNVSIAIQTKQYGVSIQLSSKVPTKTGYKFLGWSTSSSGSVSYYPGDTYTTNANLNLYPVWQSFSPEPTPDPDPDPQPGDGIHLWIWTSNKKWEKLD